MRGLFVTSAGTIWASGTDATIIHGANRQEGSFQTCSKPPESAGLDFRGIYAWNDQHAIVMSSGAGASSRMFETMDGCKTWHPLFSNPDRKGFWDTLVFNPQDATQGVLLGDPVDGIFSILRSSDGGRNWIRDKSPELANNPVGEGAFAASNSSLVILNVQGDLLFGTGGLGGPRIFRFEAHTKTWSNVALPVALKSETSGIFSIACQDDRKCLAVGGDYKQPTKRESTAFLTSDGGLTWRSTEASPRGYRSAVAWTEGTWIVAGPTGAECSRDDGDHWIVLNDESWNALYKTWAAGPNGRIASVLGEGK